MDEKKVQEIFSDEAFVQSLYELDTAQEVQTALKEKGLSLSSKEAEAVWRQLNAKNSEITSSELDSVAGGLIPQLQGPHIADFHFPKVRI